MNIDKAINLLASVTLLEMMFTIGLGVTFAQILAVATDWKTVMSALLANYLCVPIAALALLFLFHPLPAVAAGFLIVAVCPGAPYGPPFNGMAGGNVPVAVGLMVVLAATSALLAPLLLNILLPLVSRGEPLTINALQMIGTLTFTQFVPLCAGLLFGHQWPVRAAMLRLPAEKLSLLLNLALLTLILATQYRMLLQIPLRGLLGMFVLVLASFAGGWFAAGSKPQARKTLAITTSTRNVGVGLVIAASSFPGTPAVAATTAYAIFQTLLIALVAFTWGRLPSSRDGVQGVSNV